MIDPRMLAEGTRLLHIGFRKCGTTALQSTLRRFRGELAAHGVVYPGKGLNHTAEALAVTGRTNGWISMGARKQPREKWDNLSAEVSSLGTHQRAVMSSEFFDVATEPAIRGIVDDLGGDERVHVLATVRPLSKILPSSWQQNVQFGSRRSYEDWLHVVLDGTDKVRTHRAFWERHGHGEMLSRWADAVGPDHLTLVVLDDADRMLPFRTVETMLGLPTDTLPEIPGRANRSMTRAEAELIRRVNVELFAGDITWDEYTYWIRRGAGHRMWWKRKPDPDEARIETPRWALERAMEIDAGLPDHIRGLGIDVIGNLDSLAPPQPDMARLEPSGEPDTVPIGAAVQAVLGCCFSSRNLPTPAPPPASSDTVEPSGRELARELAGRLRHRLRRASAGRAPG